MDFLAILFEPLIDVGVLNNLPFLHASEAIEETGPVIRAHDGLREGYFLTALRANISARGYSESHRIPILALVLYGLSVGIV